MTSSPTFLITAAVQLLVFWFALSLREAAKAAAADYFGDPGLREEGRVTLNPAAHFDPFGSFLVPVLVTMLPVTVFGWARQGTVDFQRLKDDSRGSIWIFLAGPFANLLAAGCAVGLLLLAVGALGDQAGQSVLEGALGLYDQALGYPAFPLLFTLERFARINAFLALFHLLPFPPLDGGWLIMQYIPRDWALRLVRIEPYGRVIGMGVAMLSGVDLILATVLLLVLS